MADNGVRPEQLLWNMFNPSRARKMTTETHRHESVSPVKASTYIRFRGSIPGSRFKTAGTPHTEHTSRASPAHPAQIATFEIARPCRGSADSFPRRNPLAWRSYVISRRCASIFSKETRKVGKEERVERRKRAEEEGSPLLFLFRSELPQNTLGDCVQPGTETSRSQQFSQGRHLRAGLSSSGDSSAMSSEMGDLRRASRSKSISNPPPEACWDGLPPTPRVMESRSAPPRHALRQKLQEVYRARKSGRDRSYRASQGLLHSGFFV